MSRYLFYFWFAPTGDIQLFVFLWSACQSSVGTGGLCSGFHILTGTWSNQQQAWSGKVTWSFQEDRNSDPHPCKWESTAGSFWIPENADRRRIRLTFKCCMVTLCCTLWSFLTWLLTEDKQPLILIFQWIKCFFCFSCPTLLHSHFELTTSFCWQCCVSFIVERRQAIKFWMLMWWLASGPHTHTRGTQNKHKSTLTYYRELRCLGCLRSDVLICN